MKRCPWCRGNELLVRYHDAEWGVPVHEDRRHFELLVLEGAQAGLSWLTVLNKREGYRRAYREFDPAAVARFGAREVDLLLREPGIVRNRLKVEASIANARLFLEVQAQAGSFDRLLWDFVDGRPVVNAWTDQDQVPDRTGLSDAVSRELKRRGFRFVGSTIIYAYLQAAGVVNDHLVDCFRYRPLAGEQAASAI